MPASRRGGLVSDDAWRVSTPATVGDDCRIHGNLRAASLEVGRDDVVFGSLRAKGDVVVGRGTEIKGDVTTRGGDVHLGPGAEIWGDVAADDVYLHENATVEGTIRTRGELQTHTEEVIERVDEAAEVMADVAEELRDDGADGEPESVGDRSEGERPPDTEPRSNPSD